jgi:hypothetical protein
MTNYLAKLCTFLKRTVERELFIFLQTNKTKICLHKTKGITKYRFYFYINYNIINNVVHIHTHQHPTTQKILK